MALKPQPELKNKKYNLIETAFATEARRGFRILQLTTPRKGQNITTM